MRVPDCLGPITASSPVNTSSSAPAESVVSVSGRCPRVVPVRAELAARALGAARWAGTGFIVGGAEPTRRNVTSPLMRLARRWARPAPALLGPAALDLAVSLRF